MKLTNLIFSNDGHIGTRILVISGIAWLPLAVLTLINGTFITNDIAIPFVKDVEPYVRGLIVIPLFVMADNIIEPIMVTIMKYLKTSGIVPDSEQEHLLHIAKGNQYTLNLKWVQWMLAFLAISVSWLLQTDYVDMWIERGVTSWALHIEDGEVDPTMAGMWYLLVTSPMVSFLLYRWMWRFFAWTVFLYRVSRMKLHLYASHTDYAGGLGIIGSGQTLFGMVFLIWAILISAELANNLLYEGDKLIDLKLLIIIFIAISVAVITAPLLFFTKRLVQLKRDSLAEYGELQQQISGDFHKHWIDKQTTRLVDSMQPSAMADYSAVYEIVSGMRVVPLDLKNLLVLAVLLLLPFFPLLLTEQSIMDVLQTLGDSLS